jgi:hypothetical protein
MIGARGALVPSSLEMAAELEARKILGGWSPEQLGLDWTETCDVSAQAESGTAALDLDCWGWIGARILPATSSRTGKQIEMHSILFPGAAQACTAAATGRKEVRLTSRRGRSQAAGPRARQRGQCRRVAAGRAGRRRRRTGARDARGGEAGSALPTECLPRN